MAPLIVIFPICHTHKNRQNGISMGSPKKIEIHDVFHVKLLKTYVFDIRHLLFESLETLDVATLTLGRDQGKGLQGCRSRKRPGSHITYSRECKECEGMNPHTP